MYEKSSSNDDNNNKTELKFTNLIYACSQFLGAISINCLRVFSRRCCFSGANISFKCVMLQFRVWVAWISPVQNRDIREESEKSIKIPICVYARCTGNHWVVNCMCVNRRRVRYTLNWLKARKGRKRACGTAVWEISWTRTIKSKSTVLCDDKRKSIHPPVTRNSRLSLSSLVQIFILCRL